MNELFGIDVADALQSTERTALVRLTANGVRPVLRGSLFLDGGGLVAPFAALCTIGIPWEVTHRMPRVYCHEPWVIRRGGAWHVFLDGSMCLDFPQRWRDHLRIVLDFHGEKAAATYAAEYLFNSAQWLLNHHKYAFEERLTAWPEDWPAWAHDGRGALEYYRLTRAA